MVDTSNWLCFRNQPVNSQILDTPVIESYAQTGPLTCRFRALQGCKLCSKMLKKMFQETMSMSMCHVHKSWNSMAQHLKKKRLKPMCQPHLKNISWEIIVNQVHQCSLFFYITIIHQSFSLFLQTCPPRKSTFTPGFRKSNQRCRHCRAAAAGTIFHLGSGSRTQNLEMPGIYGILRLNDYWSPNLGGWLFWMI